MYKEKVKMGPAIPEKMLAAQIVEVCTVQSMLPPEAVIDRSYSSTNPTKSTKCQPQAKTLMNMICSSRPQPALSATRIEWFSKV
jgi:hypothetical protein